MRFDGATSRSEARSRVRVVKAAPVEVLVLQEQYAEVGPGHHMNKRHWITLRPGGGLGPQFVDDLVTDSYLLVVGNLPRTQRPVDPATFAAGWT